MNLDNIRKDINEIDDKLKALFDERMNCSEKIAKQKKKIDDVIYKPIREKEIYERYQDNPSYVTFIKKVIQLSRKKQYGVFIEDNGNGEDLFKKFILDSVKDGKMTLTLKADKSSEKALSVKDIISIIADTTLDIDKLDVDSKNNMVEVVFDVPDDDVSVKEAYVIKYMLEEETL